MTRILVADDCDVVRRGSNTCFASTQIGKYAAKQSMVRRQLKKRDSFLPT